MKKNKVVKILVIMIMLISLVGCNKLKYSVDEFISDIKGREMTIDFYDADGFKTNKSVKGKSIKIKHAKEFDTAVGSDTVQKGSVIRFTVGNSEVLSTGNTFIGYQKGVPKLNTDIKKLSAESDNQGIPFLELAKSKFQNDFKGKRRVILIESIDGKPIGVFAGNNVSVFALEGVPKTTVLQVDGKYVFLHRTNYLMIDQKLLNQQ